MEGGLYLDICVAPEFLVTPLPDCLLSQGRFEEPVRPWLNSTLPKQDVEDPASVSTGDCNATRGA